MSLMLDVNGLSTCMAHPLAEDAHLREGERATSFFRDLLYPLPLEEKPNGVLSPKLLATSRPAPPGGPVLLAVGRHARVS